MFICVFLVSRMKVLKVQSGRPTTGLRKPESSAFVGKAGNRHCSQQSPLFPALSPAPLGHSRGTTLLRSFADLHLRSFARICVFLRPTAFGNCRTPHLFSKRFREGISFPNFVERSILKLPLSKLCTVPFALQNRAPLDGEKKLKRCREKERKKGDQQRVSKM